MFKLDLETRDKIANICCIIKKAREFQKNIYFCFIGHTKTFDCVDHNKLWKILNEVGIPDHLTCLLRNLYAGQEAAVRTGHGTTDWFQIGKEVCQGCICMKLLVYITVLFLIVWGISILFSIVAAPVYIPTNSVWWFPFLTSPPTLVIHCSFEDRHFIRYECSIFAVLISFSLRIGDVEIFSCAFWPFIL